MDGDDVRAAARKVNDNRVTQGLARLGYVASGVLHLVLGLITLQVAWFRSGEAADQSGAFAMVARQPLGAVALWVLVVGFVGLAVWQLSEAIGYQRSAGDRVKAASKAVVYAALAWTALQFALGSHRSSEKQTEDFTAGVMSHTGGRWAVALAGLVVIGVGAYHVHKGWKRKFLQDLTESPGRFVTGAGVLGYVAKGVALAVAGGLFVAAGIQHRPDQAGGLDDALHTLRNQPLGAVLLTVVGIGVLAYGVYSFARARWART